MWQSPQHRDKPRGALGTTGHSDRPYGHSGALRALIIGRWETLLPWHLTHPTGLADRAQHPPNGVAVERLVLEHDEQTQARTLPRWTSTFVGVAVVSLYVQLAQDSLR